MRAASMKRGVPGCLDRQAPGGVAKALLFGLIWLLLLCHGVLGFAHQVSCGTCEPGGPPGVPATHGHTGHMAGPDVPGHEVDGAGTFAADYLAVVLLMFGALVLVLLLGARRGAGTVSAASFAITLTFGEYPVALWTRMPLSPTA
jgi:hypothetical protein